MRHSLPSQTYRYQYNLEVGHVGLAYVVEVCSVKCETLRGGDGTGRRVDGEKLLRDIGALHEHADVVVHESLDAAAAALPAPWWGFSSRATTRYTEASIANDHVLVFGAERAGLDSEAIDRIGADRMLTIPMQAESRSLNLANAVSVVVYDAWRRQGFPGASDPRSGLTSESLSEPVFDP